MTSNAKTGSAKEMTATINNLKESRVLEKSVHTLSLEETFATKILDLDKKLLKFRYWKLKRNVNKIKTYLKADHLLGMKEMEVQGKLPVEQPGAFSSVNALKISAAERRLKLQNHVRSQSAPAKPARKDFNINQLKPSGCTNPSTAKEPTISERIRRPKTVACTSSEVIHRDGLADHEVANERTIKTTDDILEFLAQAKKASKNLTVQASYSCHDEKSTPPADINKEDCVLDSFSQNPFEERRLKFIALEDKNSKFLENRKKMFVASTQKFIGENPVNNGPAADVEKVIKSVDSMSKRPETAKNSRQNKHIDLKLIHRAIFTSDRHEREFYTSQLMRKGSSVQESVEDLFQPIKFKNNMLL